MKRTVVYIVAAIIALGIALGLFTVFRNQTVVDQSAVVTERPVETPQPVEMVEVIVANRMISADEEITRDMLRTNIVPATQRPYFAVNNIEEIEGTIARVNIQEETVILSTMVENPSVYIAETQGLSYEVPEGFVGLAIPTSGLDGVAGYLLPGDVVNILADAKAVKAAQNGIDYSDASVNTVSKAYLVKNVTILAVGDKAYDQLMASNAIEVRTVRAATVAFEEDGETATTDNGSDGTYNCLIIALDDFTAQLVVETMQNSKLTLALKHRNYGIQEVTMPEVVPVTQDFDYTPKSNQDVNQATN